MDFSTYKKIITIDPDLEKNGVAIYDTQTKVCQVGNAYMWELFFFLLENKDAFIILENSGLSSKQNWHGKASGKNVGKNMGVSMVISDFLKAYKFSVLELSPQGFSRFKTHEAMLSATNIEMASSNNEQRSALCIVMKFFKIKKVVKVKFKTYDK